MSANPLPAVSLTEVIEFLHSHPEFVKILEAGGTTAVSAVNKVAELISEKFHLTPKS